MGGVAVTAEEFGLKGPRGWAFRGIGLDAEPGALIAVEGVSGSGRTCLLLALTGRMKASEGTAAVGGARLPKQLAAVRQAERFWQEIGIHSVPAVIVDRKHLISGGQPSAVFEQALRQIAAESAPG